MSPRHLPTRALPPSSPDHAGLLPCFQPTPSTFYHFPPSMHIHSIRSARGFSLQGRRQGGTFCGSAKGNISVTRRIRRWVDISRRGSCSPRLGEALKGINHRVYPAGSRDHWLPVPSVLGPRPVCLYLPIHSRMAACLPRWWVRGIIAASPSLQSPSSSELT